MVSNPIQNQTNKQQYDHISMVKAPKLKDSSETKNQTNKQYDHISMVKAPKDSSKT